ncbi:MAG TPA: hypothetical protein VGF34_10445 [Stellaceae bacterium]
MRDRNAEQVVISTGRGDGHFVYKNEITLQAPKLPIMLRHLERRVATMKLELEALGVK